MKRFLTAAAVAALALGLTVTSMDAEARRFGGGKSFGMKRDNALMTVSYTHLTLPTNREV